MKRSPRSRVPSPLPGSIQQHLSTYALAAGAAGVGLLAMAQPSFAEVVYTPADVTIGRNGIYSLDVNQDGTTDFILMETVSHPRSGPSSRQTLWLKSRPGNGANCASTFCASSFMYPAPLDFGTKIPAHNRGWVGGDREMALEERFSGNSYLFGTWGYYPIKGEYLGLRFEINGETHFGWARLSVQFRSGSSKERTWELHLSGFAYETIAGKGIHAGQTEGDGDAKV
ncbi:MAG: hypothetical protein WA824_14600, partial [Candidatus Sulfotelmatobacter sp.]